jgi:tetratricopeptide (TPR) repeat protein
MSGKRKWSRQPPSGGRVHINLSRVPRRQLLRTKEPAELGPPPKCFHWTELGDKHYSASRNGVEGKFELGLAEVPLSIMLQFVVVTGNVILAIDDLTAFIRLRPSFPESYYKRGLLYGELGDKDKAGGDFRKTLELEPSYAPASHALTRLDEMVHPGVGKPENLPPGSP